MMSKIISQGTYRYREVEPQSSHSVTIPNQAPTLKYIIGAVQQGQALNLKMDMRFDKDANLDALDLRTAVEDPRNVTTRQIDALLSIEPVPAAVVTPSQESTPAAVVTPSQESTPAAVVTPSQESTPAA